MDSPKLKKTHSKHQNKIAPTYRFTSRICLIFQWRHGHTIQSPRWILYLCRCLLALLGRLLALVSTFVLFCSRFQAHNLLNRTSRIQKGMKIENQSWRASLLEKREKPGDWQKSPNPFLSFTHLFYFHLFSKKFHHIIVFLCFFVWRRKITNSR